MARLQATTLKMMPMVESVMVPMVAQSLDETGAFKSNELVEHSAQQMLDELAKWSGALASLRPRAPESAAAAASAREAVAAA